MKIESFQDLVELSHKLHELNEQKNLICPNYKSLDNNNHLINILYEQLNELQRKCFNDLHRGANEEYCIALLDSRPGTGKSHLMATFALSCNLNMLFIVYKQELVNNMKKIPYWDCFTAAKFKIRLFQLQSYKSFFSKFTTSPTTFDIIARIFVMNKMMDQKLIDKYDMFIIDEYTVLNPEMLLAICFMAIRNKKTLIFCGDRCQQNAIEKSSQSGGLSNYYFLSIISTVNINITNSMRCVDDEYNQKIERFRSIIELSGGGSTPINYYYGLILYELFNENFYKQLTYEDGCYFAIHHKLLTRHTINILQRIPHHMSHVYSPNCTIADYDDKFFYGLPLVIGKTYVFCNKKHKSISHGQHVKLLEYRSESDTIIIKDTSNNKIYNLHRVRMTPENILDSLYERLNLKFKGPFLQFPIKPLFTSTYHNAQGLTLNNMKIDLNVKGATCESVYVGLSRIKMSSQLNRIEYDKVMLDSYEYTTKQNDIYYYLVVDKSSIHFKETSSWKAFEKSKFNSKILKSILQPSKMHIQNAPIVEATIFIKKNLGWCQRKYIEFKGESLKDNLGLDITL